MKIIAIWIIDHNYVVPAYLSISSFLVSNKIPIIVVFCGDEGKSEAELLFSEMDEVITFSTFETPECFKNDPRKGQITNRLARMHYASQGGDEVYLLLDADILFTHQGDELLGSIKSNLVNGESTIFGVLDAPISYRDYNYFRTKDSSGRTVSVSHIEQRDIYQTVFGANWWHHLKGPSINNGVVAFYKAKEVIEVWRTFYLKGLENNKVNPADDQLPLAAAIYKTTQKVVTLHDKFNSKGEVSGDYIVYHALSSTWKMQIRSAYFGEIAVSDFADLAKQVISNIPAHLMAEFIENQLSIEPYLFRGLDGKFGFQHLYKDIISGIDSGAVVEVGSNNGKSTCFMLELIQNSQKDIRFYALSIKGGEKEKIDPFFEIVDRFKLNKKVEFNYLHNNQLHNQIEEQVDFVFLNLENNYDMLSENLELWYTKLKPGGILAGYDYTSQSGLHFGNHCATYDFSVKRNLSLRISFNIFIIEKPRVDYILSEEAQNALVLKESNEKQ